MPRGHYKVKESEAQYWRSRQTKHSQLCKKIVAINPSMDSFGYPAMIGNSKHLVVRAEQIEVLLLV